ncbi:MAG: hypothetical protein H7839_21615 [Magnetococcus sp. YQC-5]
MIPMTYKGYTARIEYSNEDACFVGRVAVIKPLITFHGKSITKVKHAFQKSVDFYLETCASRGENS